MAKNYVALLLIVGNSFLFSGLTFTEKWTTENVLNTEITVEDQLTKGLKLGLDTSFAPQTGCIHVYCHSFMLFCGVGEAMFWSCVPTTKKKKKDYVLVLSIILIYIIVIVAVLHLRTKYQRSLVSVCEKQLMNTLF